MMRLDTTLGSDGVAGATGVSSVRAAAGATVVLGSLGAGAGVASGAGTTAAAVSSEFVDAAEPFAVAFFAGLAGSSPSGASFFAVFLAGLGSSGATSRTSPRSLAVDTIMSAKTGCNELEAFFTGIMRPEARSTTSLLVMPSCLAKSLTLIFFSAIRLLVPHVVGRRTGGTFCHGGHRDRLFPDDTVCVGVLREKRSHFVDQGFHCVRVGGASPGPGETTRTPGCLGAAHRAHPSTATHRRRGHPTRVHTTREGRRRLTTATTHAGAQRSRSRRQD